MEFLNGHSAWKKTLFSQFFTKGEVPKDDKKINKYREDKGDHDIVSTNFTLQKGQSYEIVVNLDFSLNSAAGNHFALFTGRTISINLKIK